MPPTYGVAKKATLWAVVLLDADGPAHRAHGRALPAGEPRPQVVRVRRDQPQRPRLHRRDRVQLGASVVLALVETSYVGRPVSLPIQASGGTTPYRFTATGLPSGLSINQSTGVIAGTPTAWQNANVTVTVTDAAGRTARAQSYWFVFPY